jgi:secondary thiamine-phosphate synthase enzyme
MKAYRVEIKVRTQRRTQMVDITSEVEKALAASGCAEGICYLCVPHTTAGILINEGDDPAVARDIEAALDKLIPRDGGYQHAEGNSDSHIKTALCGTSAVVMVEGGRLTLGRWQAIFFAEFDGPRQREVRVKIVPDGGE